MARSKSTSGLSEMWIPADLTADLSQLSADHLMVYLATVDMRGNTTGCIDQWVSTHVARHAGVSERVVAAAHKRLIELKLHTLDSGPKGQGPHPRVRVRVGTGNASRRLPVAAVWTGPKDYGPKDNGPRWGANSGHAVRAILALLNVMDHHHPTTHLPHKEVAKRAGLASAVYRQGFTVVADTHYVDVHKRWLAPGDRGGPIAGIQQDSNRITFRWDLLAAEVEDCQALQSLANAHRACIEAAKFAFVSTKHVDFPAGDHVDFPASDHVEKPAGDHVDFPAGIFKFFGLQVLLSSSSFPSTPAAAAATQPSRTVNHATMEEDGEAGQEQETPKLTLVPAPSLTVSDVLNAKGQDDAAALIRATVDREGGWRALTDESWIASTIAAIYYAPAGHSLPITEAGARHLATALLKRRAVGFTPLALATQLVGDHLNAGVRNVVSVLHHRLTSIPDNAWRGSDDDPNTLLTAQQMVPRNPTVAAHARQVDPRNPTGRDRSDGATYSTTFD